MYLIPKIVPYKTDELLYSWQQRLAEANGFDTLYEFGRFYIYPNVKSAKELCTRRVFHDGREDFEIFYKALATDIPMWKLYQQVTCYPALAPLLAQTQQIQLLNCAFRRAYEQQNGMTSTINSLTPELRFCPKCREENLDGVLYYRAHQLPGVCVCHKHHCLLWFCKPGENKNRSEEITPNASNEIMAAYANYAKNFLDAAPEGDIGSTKAVIMNRLSQCGYYDAAGGYPALKSAISSAGLDGLFTKNIEKYLRVTLTSKQYVPIQDTMALIFFLFGNVGNFLVTIGDIDESDVDLVSRLREGYKLCSPVKQNLIELEHTVCKEHFCSTMTGFISGWNCPICDKQRSSAEIYDNLVRTAEHGKYKLLAPYTQMCDNVRLRHICGREIIKKARTFLYDGTRCKCESQLTTDRLQNEISQYGDFELLNYVGSESRMTIRHKSCNQIFQCTYAKFAKYPWCKACRPKFQRTQESFATEIKDLTGDEYVLVGAYADKDIKVRIRHNRCGTEHRYRVSSFLRGSRCPKCHKFLSRDKFALVVSTLSNGTYSYNGMATENLAIIRNTHTDKTIQMAPDHIIQELKRPTPSKLLPCEKKDMPADLLLTKKEAVEQWLAKHCTVTSAIFLEDVKQAFPWLNTKTVEHLMRSIQRENKLHQLGFGIYGLPESDLSTNEIVHQRYVQRGDEVIGYYYGQTFAYQIKLLQQSPQTTYVATNKEAGLHGRDVNICGMVIHARGVKTPVTEENCKILQFLDLLPNITKYSDLSAEGTEQVLKKYLHSHPSITVASAKQFFHLYAPWVENKFYKLMEK